MKRLALFVAFLWGLAALPPASAGAAVYWSATGFLGAANDDGSQVLFPLPSGTLPTPQIALGRGLAVDGSHLYWADGRGGAIGRGGLDGTNLETTFITGLVEPCGVAVDGDHIYWADRFAGVIGRASLDGSEVDPAFVKGADRPCGIAVGAEHLYWGNEEGHSIGRAAIDGSEVEQQFIGGLTEARGIAVDGGHIYWGERNDVAPADSSIARATLLGTEVETQFVPGAGEPDSVAVDATGIYWANEGLGGSNSGSIARANLDGSGVRPSLVGGLRYPAGVAIDSRVIPPPAAPPPLAPSDYLRIGPLARISAKGTVQLPVYVPTFGAFTVDTPGLGWRLGKRNDPQPPSSQELTWILTLWPGGGAEGQRIRNQLRRRGRAPVTLRVTYQQGGRLPLEVSRPFAFVRQVRKTPPHRKAHRSHRR